MSLHVETFGSGAPLLLIHGWGMHGGMWGELVEKLAADFCVHLVDLPGHGLSGKWETESGQSACRTHSPLTSHLSPIDAIVAELSARFAQPLTLCGWSLGGQIALRWAQLEPQKIQHLVLVSSTPCFAQRADWLEAMPLATLAEFTAALADNPTQTLRRFVALQTRGSDNERALLTRLRNELFTHGEPDWSVLQSGLDILRDCDLRDALPNINQPSLVIAGERDTLTPHGASEYMAATMPNARLASIAGAAHAPFLSHPEQFLTQVLSFMKSKNN